MNTDDLTEQDTDCPDGTAFSSVPRAYLIIGGSGLSRVVEIPTDGEVLIGRGEEATVRLDDARVSRKHVRIAWCQGALLVEDLGGRNGTLINRVTLKRESQAARGGDRIHLAGHEITIAIVASPVETTQPAPGPAADMLGGMIVADPTSARVFGLARRVARSSTTALILGETGAGKDVLARQIHAWSQRSSAAFVQVNCAALPESLAESELFGYERGAFTGADRRKIGLAEAAHGGTLFLDEIGELTSPVQAKLLAALENRSIVRVGSTVETPVDLRVICATQRDLTKEIKEGRFREDLYYRIGVVVIRVPPLRERPSEILLLANMFAKRFGERLQWCDPIVDPGASEALLAHNWPGNVRELRNAIEHAMLVTEDGTLRREHLPETLTNNACAAESVVKGVPAKPTGIRLAVAEVERASIEDALRAEAGNRTRAARQLGISLRSLLYKIEKYGLARRASLFPAK